MKEFKTNSYRIVACLFSIFVGLGGFDHPLKAEAITVAPLFFIASNNYRTMQEEFRDIPDWEGFYQVSDLANVKSLEREFLIRGKHPTTKKERILKPGLDSGGYLTVVLCKEGKQKTFRVSVLIMMAFRGHVPCGYKIIVDHKDNIKTNNRLNNLQLISQRENSSKDKKGGSSKYTGVNWDKGAKKWKVAIQINRKYKHLGYFDDELEASEAYQKELNQLIA